jgi:hypothetical protein
VFDRSLATSVSALVAAIDWASAQDMALVNLSLGTAQAAHETALRAAVDRAAARGVLIVSARDDGTDDRVRWLPGALPGVLAVQVDWRLPRDRYRAVSLEDRTVFQASGFAREIPGVPRERNLHGVSFAVAHMSGFAARALESIEPDRTLAALVTALRGCAQADVP